MSILAAIAALIVGFTLGLLGGGGSILTIPILVYLLDVPEKIAIATSLLVVGATSIIGVAGHAKAGNVVWRTGLVFGLFAMGGAYLGGQLARFIPGGVLMVLFAILMLVTAIAMLRGRRTPGPQEQEQENGAGAGGLPIPKVAAVGLLIGAVTGLVGAGGGFLIVPALVLLGRLPMKKAIGTSLFVVVMNSFAGFAGYIDHVTIDYVLAGTFVAASVVGTLIGIFAGSRIDNSVLRKGFAVFVLVMGVVIVLQKLALTWTPAVIVGVVAVLLTGGAALFWWLRAGQSADELA